MVAFPGIVRHISMHFEKVSVFTDKNTMDISAFLMNLELALIPTFIFVGGILETFPCVEKNCKTSPKKKSL
jgi:hypothetical protein